MPKIDLVEMMRKPPGRCGICNTTPMTEGKPREAIDTNVDVDWGNNFYICDECAGVIADLIDRVPQEEHANLRAKHHQLEKDHENLRSKYRNLAGTAKKVVEGRKAESKIKKKRKAAA